MKKWLSILLAAVSGFLCVGLFAACQKGADGDNRYEIVAEYIPETATVTGTVKLEFINRTGNALSALKFALPANAYRADAALKPLSPAYSVAAYYAGKSFGDMQITSVGGGKSFEVTGEDANILCVELEGELYPSEKVTVDIAFTTKLAKVNHRTGLSERAVNLGNFYPVLCHYGKSGFVECAYYSDGDPFLTDCADYFVTFTAPKEYQVASSGKTTEVKSLESKQQHTIYATNVRDFAIVLSPNFKKESCFYKGVELAYFYQKDETPAAHLALVKQCFSYFYEQFGAYPYETYTVVETGFCLGGMEYPALAMIDYRLEDDERVKAIVHETAHQWWYAVVGSNQIENAWQDEGLAEYSAALFFDAHETYGHTEQDLVQEATENYRSYFDVYSRVFGETDTRMTRHLKEFISEYEYRSIAYDKGVILFHTLRSAIGGKRFVQGLKNYYKRCAYKVATPTDLIGAFEATGVDVHGLFSSFLNGTAIV